MKPQKSVMWKPNTSQYLVGSFIILILLGVLLLNLSFVSNSGQSVGFLDALFTVTSAACVTGQVVVTTAARATMITEKCAAPFVIVKATPVAAQKMLERPGADLLMFPEKEAGGNLARRLFNHDVMEILHKIPDFNLSDMSPHKGWMGKTVGESKIRKSAGLIIFALERGGKMIAPVGSSEILQEDDTLYVWEKE